MINTLLEHIPIKMEKKENGEDGDVDDGSSDNEEEEEDDDEEEEDSELSETDVDEATLMISSEEEAELEAQRINFHELIGKNLLQPRHRVRGRSASSNCSSVKSTTTTSSVVVVVTSEHQRKETTKRTKNRTYSTCSVASSLVTPSSQTESCGNIYVFQEQQKLIFNCSFCDLRYSNMPIFAKHLHEAHQLFQGESSGGGAEEKVPAEPQRKSTRNAARRTALQIEVKKELPSPDDEELEPQFALPPASACMESCGNIFVLNSKKLFLICGYCECKYANLELFHKHLRQQHQLFSGPTKDIDVLPKTEVKTELALRATGVANAAAFAPVAVEEHNGRKSLSSSPLTIQPMVAIPDGINLSNNVLRPVVLLPVQTPETPPPEESMEQKEMEGEIVEPIVEQEINTKEVEPQVIIENSVNAEEEVTPQKQKEQEINVPQEKETKVGSKEKEPQQEVENGVNTGEIVCREQMDVEEIAPEVEGEKEDAKEIESPDELENNVYSKKVASHNHVSTEEIAPQQEEQQVDLHEEPENKVNTEDAAPNDHIEGEKLVLGVAEKDEEKVDVQEEKEEKKVSPTRKRKRKSTYGRRRSPSKRPATTKAAKPLPEPTAATTRMRRTSSTQKSYKDFFVEQQPPSSPESAISSKSILQQHLRLPETAPTNSAAIVNIKESSDSNSLVNFRLELPTTSHSTLKVAQPFSAVSAKKKLRFACDQCPKAFNKSSRLTEHKRLHTGEKPFGCDECGKQFRIKMRLTEHQMRHRKEKAFKCETCGLPLATKQDLTQHQRHHNDDRRYRCPECPKAFVRSSDLKIHVRVHTGEKPYVCEICQRSFRANQNLIVHRRSHLGDKKYKCEYCEKSFMRNIDRKVHMRSHTGEKPFKCEICQRGYSSRVHVRAHIEREHVQGANGTKPERKKPGPRPKQIKEELAKQKKLIEELQQKFLDQIKTDENLLSHENVAAQQQRQQPSSPIIRKQQQRQRQQSPSSRLLQKIEHHSPPLRTQGDGGGVQQVSVTVSMQVENVAAVAEKENESSMLTRSHSPLKENATTLTTANVKKERKITSFFTVVGQKTEI